MLPSSQPSAWLQSAQNQRLLRMPTNYYDSLSRIALSKQGLHAKLQFNRAVCSTQIRLNLGHVGYTTVVQVTEWRCNAGRQSGNGHARRLSRSSIAAADCRTRQPGCPWEVPAWEPLRGRWKHTRDCESCWRHKPSLREEHGAGEQRGNTLCKVDAGS